MNPADDLGTSDLPARGTISIWIDDLKAGDSLAAGKIWECFFQRLVALAQKHIAGNARAMADEEDVVLSAFNSVFCGARKGQFARLIDRDDLWQILALVTRRKAIDLVEYQKRKKRSSAATLSLGGREATNSRSSGGDLEPVAPQPSVEMTLQFAEELERLLNLLKGDPLRHIAVWKMEGYSNAEIAKRLDCAERTVERKLWLIKTTWESATSD